MKIVKTVLLIIALIIATLIAIKVIVFLLGALAFLVIYGLPPIIVLFGVLYYFKYVSEQR
jgi:hypothetical protein